MPNQNQEIITIIIVGGLLGLFFVAFIIGMLFLYQKRQNQFKREIANMKQDYQERLLKVQYETQENIFREISRKLHHDVKNSIDVITLGIKKIAFQLQMGFIDASKAQEALEELALQNEEVKQQVRLTSHSLMPERIKQIGLIDAIQYEIKILKQNTQVEFDAQLDINNPHQFNEKEAIFIFRLFQESIGNVLHHSKATRVKVLANFTPKNTFELYIEDNGVGFNLAELKKSKKVGIGLMDLQHRAAQVNATYTLNSKPGAGTITTLVLPLAA